MQHDDPLVDVQFILFCLLYVRERQTVWDNPCNNIPVQESWIVGWCERESSLRERAGILGLATISLSTHFKVQHIDISFQSLQISLPTLLWKLSTIKDFGVENVLGNYPTVQISQAERQAGRHLIHPRYWSCRKYQREGGFKSLPQTKQPWNSTLASYLATLSNHVASHRIHSPVDTSLALTAWSLPACYWLRLDNRRSNCKGLWIRFTGQSLDASSMPKHWKGGICQPQCRLELLHEAGWWGCHRRYLQYGWRGCQMVDNRERTHSTLCLYVHSNESRPNNTKPGRLSDHESWSCKTLCFVDAQQDVEFSDNRQHLYTWWGIFWIMLKTCQPFSRRSWKYFETVCTNQMIKLLWRYS